MFVLSYGYAHVGLAKFFHLLNMNRASFQDSFWAVHSCVYFGIWQWKLHLCTLLKTYKNYAWLWVNYC